MAVNKGGVLGAIVVWCVFEEREQGEGGVQFAGVLYLGITVDILHIMTGRKRNENDLKSKSCYLSCWGRSNHTISPQVWWLFFYEKGL